MQSELLVPDQTVWGPLFQRLITNQVSPLIQSKLIDLFKEFDLIGIIFRIQPFKTFCVAKCSFGKNV